MNLLWWRGARSIWRLSAMVIGSPRGLASLLPVAAMVRWCCKASCGAGRLNGCAVGFCRSADGREMETAGRGGGHMGWWVVAGQMGSQNLQRKCIRSNPTYGR